MNEYTKQFPFCFSRVVTDTLTSSRDLHNMSVRTACNYIRARATAQNATLFFFPFFCFVARSDSLSTPSNDEYIGSGVDIIVVDIMSLVAPAPALSFYFSFLFRLLTTTTTTKSINGFFPLFYSCRVGPCFPSQTR